MTPIEKTLYPEQKAEFFLLNKTTSFNLLGLAEGNLFKLAQIEKIEDAKSRFRLT